MDVKIYEGWPLPEQLDLDLAGNMLGSAGTLQPRSGGRCAHVTVFPMQGTTPVPYQILDEFYVIIPPVYGITGTVNGNTLTLTGTPGVGGFVTVIADNNYISSRTGASVAAILSNLASDLSADYASVNVTSSTLQLPTAAYFVARIGAPAVMGKVTHRQKQSLMITVWAPDPTTRKALAIAIDGIIKQAVRYTMPDTSQIVLVYNRTNQTDEHETVTVYRRDLIFEAEYATVEQFPAYPVTVVPATIGPLDTVYQDFQSLTNAS